MTEHERDWAVVVGFIGNGEPFEENWRQDALEALGRVQGDLKRLHELAEAAWEHPNRKDDPRDKRLEEPVKNPKGG